MSPLIGIVNGDDGPETESSRRWISTSFGKLTSGIQVLRAHIASGPERNKGWLRAVFDPQMGTALSAIHDSVKTLWTVESLAEAAGMSRSAFAARFKELLGQSPLEYVTEWRMQKAMQLLQQREKKLIDVARLVGYESDAAFSKAAFLALNCGCSRQ